MIRVGCSSFSIILKVVGLFPLIGGGIGIYKFIDAPSMSYAGQFQTIILIVFGLFAFGYRSCLFLFDRYAEIERRLFFFFTKKKRFEYSQMNEILVEMRRSTFATADDLVDSAVHYDISLRGDAQSLDFTDYIKFNTRVLNKKSWTLVSNLANKIANVSGLTINYSDKVKRYNSLD